MSPQLQWLGTMPEEKPFGAGAAKGFGEAFIGAKEKREERELDLAKISFTKKQKAADMVMKQTEYATPQQKKKIVESEAGKLVRDVYGDEGYDTWAGVGSSKGKAGDVAEVKTWIALQGKPSKFDRYGIRINKENMSREIAFKLDDTDWKTTYPDLAAALEVSYKEKPKEPKKGWFGRIDYKSLSDADLHARTLQGDQAAIAEARRRGY